VSEYIPDLDAVLFDYLADEPPPSYDKLCEWCKRYPQYAKELADLEVGRAMIETLGPKQVVE